MDGVLHDLDDAQDVLIIRVCGCTTRNTGPSCVAERTVSYQWYMRELLLVTKWTAIGTQQTRLHPDLLLLALVPSVTLAL